jgi:hypothetical protein
VSTRNNDDVSPKKVHVEVRLHVCSTVDTYRRLALPVGFSVCLWFGGSHHHVQVPVDRSNTTRLQSRVFISMTNVEEKEGIGENKPDPWSRNNYYTRLLVSSLQS